jgi:hypothetical protein
VKRAIVLLASSAALAASPVALAQAAPEPFPVIAPAAPVAASAPVADAAAPPRSATRPGEVTLGVGLRGMVLPTAGLDPYASGNNFLMMSSIAAGVTLFRAGRASIVASLEWNVGSRSDSARGQASELTLHRLGGALETRFQPARRLYLFARLAPAAYKVLGSIQAEGLDRPLVARPWTWGLDTTGGAGLLMGTVGPLDRPSVRFWFTTELGYAFAGSASMSYAPAGSDTDPARYGSIMLPAFKPAGGVGRLGIAVAF